MELDPKQKEELEKLEKGIQEKKFDRKDPYSTNRTLYNPQNGDMYVTVTDSNGNIKRKVFNLFGE
jgi:hypothetical protein